MTDARLLKNKDLLLGWSASLNHQRLSFDEYAALLDKEAADDPFITGGSCADDAGFSVRVSEGPELLAK